MFQLRALSATFARTAPQWMAPAIVPSYRSFSGSGSAQSITAQSLTDSTRAGWKLRTTIKETQMMSEAAKLMREHKWGLLIVVDAAGKYKGTESCIVFVYSLA